MVPPIVILCMQLIVVTTSSISGRSLALEDHHRPRLEALFAAAGASNGPRPVVAKPSPDVILTSKRQQSLQLPTLIDSSDNSFAFRQHHQQQPPAAGGEGHNYGPQHHFRQGHHQHQHPLQVVEDFPQEELQDYDQRDQFNPDYSVDGLGSSVESGTNEIGDNPFFAPTGGGGTGPGGLHNSAGHSNLESIDLIREQLERVKEEEDIDIKSNLLMRLLEQLPEGPLPVVYIEDAGENSNALNSDAGDGNDDSDATIGEVERFTANGDKRSGRYYRRYPWKRQNARSRTYDADARYLCVPSREDVFKLLVGLHENRIGNHQKTINFCNRKRPAKAIFTNIRFLG